MFSRSYRKIYCWTKSFSSSDTFRVLQKLYYDCISFCLFSGLISVLCLVIMTELYLQSIGQGRKTFSLFFLFTYFLLKIVFRSLSILFSWSVSVPLLLDLSYSDSEFLMLQGWDNFDRGSRWCYTLICREWRELGIDWSLAYSSDFICVCL